MCSFFWKQQLKIRISSLPCLYSSAYCVCWFCFGFWRQLCCHIGQDTPLDFDLKWTSWLNKKVNQSKASDFLQFPIRQQLLHYPWAELKRLTRYNNQKYLYKSTSKSSLKCRWGAFTEDYEGNSECWVRSGWRTTGHGEVISWRESGHEQTSLWVLLIPQLSLNLFHNLSGTRIKLLSDSERSFTVIREHKQAPKSSMWSCD